MRFIRTPVLAAGAVTVGLLAALGPGAGAAAASSPVSVASAAGGHGSPVSHVTVAQPTVGENEEEPPENEEEPDEQEGQRPA